MRPAADVILIGRTLALDPQGTTGEAIAIAGGRVQRVGSNEAVMALRGPHTVVHDFRGRTIIPGFNDTHAHLDSMGLQRLRPSLDAADGIASIQATIRALARVTPKGQWIVTMPVGKAPFYFEPVEQLRERRLPNRAELDAAAPEHPVYVSAPSGYWGGPPCFTALNSLGLALNGIDRHRQPRAKGVEIEHDAAGEPTGILIDRNYPEAALLDLLPAVPRFTPDERLQAIRLAQPLYHARGTTSIYEGHGSAPIMISHYRKLHELGQLTMRVGLVVNPLVHSVEDAQRQFRDWLAYAQGAGLGDSMLRVTGVCLAYGGDPVIGALARSDPTDISWSGYVKQSFDPAQFEALVMLAAQHDLRVHVIAADWVDEVLAPIERVASRIPVTDRRWVLEHLAKSTPAAIERIRKLGLGVTLIPSFHLWKVGERYHALPAQDQDWLLPARQLLAAGVPVSSGTDAVPNDPLMAVWSMVARRDRKRNQVLGSGAGLDVTQALKLATVAGAWLTFEEHVKGPLAPGYFADLAVLSDDPCTVEPDRIPEIECVATMVGGRWVHGDIDTARTRSA